jgi:plasmid replication initiation protein
MDNQEGIKREQALLAISKDPFRIIKGNPLIEARFELTAIQTKLFIFLLSKLDTSKDKFEPMIVAVKDFQKFTGIKGDSLYFHLKKEVEKMLDKRVYYKKEGIELNSNLVSGYLYLEKEGAFLVEFPTLLKPYLLQLKENFTVIDIRNILGLDSSYAMRFYEICKEKERFKTFEFSVDEIKAMFAIEGKYKNYFDFKTKVIIQARNELMLNSELYFDFIEIKQGKKVVAIKFTVVKNKKQLRRQDEPINLEEVNVEEQQIKEVFELVKVHKISKDTVLTWFSKYTYEHIKKVIIYTFNERKKGNVNDVAKYLQGMIKKENLFTEAEEQKKEKEQKQEQARKEEEQRKQERDIEQTQNNLKSEYSQRKQQLAVSLIQETPELHNEIMQQLRAEYEDEKRSISIELALENYKLKTGLTSLEEFMDNFVVGGMFQAYVLEKLNNQFSVFQDLKNEYLPKAKQIGLKEKDFF